MQVTAQEVANILSGEIVGDPSAIITGPGKIEEAMAGDISFLSNLKYQHHIYTTNASAVIVSRDFEPEHPIKATLIKVDNVYASLGVLLHQFGNNDHGFEGVSDQAIIDPTAQIGNNTSIAPGAYIAANAVIGDDVVIYPNAYIGKGTTIGKATILHAGVRVLYNCVIGAHCELWPNVVIGSDGFGYSPNPNKSYTKLSQIGNVIIEDNVDVGANTVIDRATLGSTIIREGVKLDNLIQVAHNVEIGAHTVIASQTGIAGSTKIGKYNVIGGQVGIVGHIKIADGVMIQAQSGIPKTITEENSKWYGSPAIEYRNYLKSYASFKNFSDIIERIKTLETELQDLKKEQ